MQTRPLYHFISLRFSLLLALGITGLSISVYLTLVGFSMSQTLGCGGGAIFDCSHVLNSKWSKLMGVPVGLFAAITYLLFNASLVSGQLVRPQWQGLANEIKKLCAFTAGAAAIWFLFLQIFVLQHLCYYCLAVHTCSLVILYLVISSSRNNFDSFKLVGASSVAPILLMGLIQTLSPEPLDYKVEELADAPVDPVAPNTSPFGEDFDPTQLFSEISEEASGDSIVNDGESTSEAQNIGTVIMNTTPVLQLYLPKPLMTFINFGLITLPKKQDDNKAEVKGKKFKLLNGKLKLDSKQWPILGNMDSKYIIAEFFDYTCGHCRATAKTLESTVADSNGDLAILLIPVPMNSKCNSSVQSNHPSHAQACELAEIAVAVWLTSPDKFPQYHEFLMTGNSAPSAQAAMRQAKTVVGSNALNKTLKSGYPKKYVAWAVDTYKYAGSGQVPRIMFPKTSLVGKLTSAQVLKQLIQQNFMN